MYSLMYHGGKTWMAVMAIVLLAGGFVIHGANAQQTNAAFTPGSHDIKQPIAITSDTLEIDQEKQMATFAGKVDAVQGNLRIRADHLEVFYATSSDEDNSADSITRMRATGNVFIISPNETAEGELADYDVITKTISLRQNVRLTQGQNVLCGNALDLFLDTGRSLLKGGCSNNKGKRKRVQGLFFPKK